MSVTMSDTTPGPAVHPVLEAEFTQRTAMDRIVAKPEEADALDELMPNVTTTDNGFMNIRLGKPQTRREQYEQRILDISDERDTLRQENYWLGVGLLIVIVVMAILTAYLLGVNDHLRAVNNRMNERLIEQSEGKGIDIIHRDSVGSTSTDAGIATLAGLNNGDIVKPVAIPAADIRQSAHITHYYSTGYATASGMNPEEAYVYATVSLGLQGIVAVGEGVFDLYETLEYMGEEYQVIEILSDSPTGHETAGKYWVVDKSPTWNNVDIYIPDWNAGDRENRWSYESEIRRAKIR